jgi:hypothetical protein
MALATASAMAVAVTGLVGFRAGRGDATTLAVQIQLQQTTIAELADDLTKARAERDKLQAQATPAQAPTPAPTSTAQSARRHH